MGKLDMEVPIIDLGGLEGESREETMALLNQACEKFGFFQVINHGIDEELMTKVRGLVNSHYEEQVKESFYQSEMAKGLLEKSPTCNASDMDWESSFFLWHLPTSNLDDFHDLAQELRKAMEEYIKQVIKLAEKLLELMSENLGLEKEYFKKQFSGDHNQGPSVGTKVAKYPQCPQPKLVNGLRAHTDAGGVIILVQDDQVPGLQFLKDGKWVDIIPTPTWKGKSTIFINTGDQLEVISNGRYKSAWHRVLATKDGSRLSIATFYNPAADALISPAPNLLYPCSFRFQDYLRHYATTKFSDKGPRFQAMKKTELSESPLPA